MRIILQTSTAKTVDKRTNIDLSIYMHAQIAVESRLLSLNAHRFLCAVMSSVVLGIKLRKLPKDEILFFGNSTAKSMRVIEMRTPATKMYGQQKCRTNTYDLRHKLRDLNSLRPQRMLFIFCAKTYFSLWWRVRSMLPRPLYYTSTFWKMARFESWPTSFVHNTYARSRACVELAVYINGVMCRKNNDFSICHLIEGVKMWFWQSDVLTHTQLYTVHTTVQYNEYVRTPTRFYSTVPYAFHLSHHIQYVCRS